MNPQEEQKQKAITRFASIVVGLEGANYEDRKSALDDAIMHGITNTECIREGLRLKAFGVRLVEPAEQSCRAGTDSSRAVRKSILRTAAQLHANGKEDVAFSGRAAA